jgi:hypothetical protein
VSGRLFHRGRSFRRHFLDGRNLVGGGGQAFRPVDLGIDRLGRRDPGRPGVPGQRELDTTPHGVKGLYDKITLLTFAQDLARRTRRLIAHAGQR